MIPRYPVTFRRYQATDYDAVAALWTRINRELAPAGMEELFERYIATTIDGELKQLPEVFSEAKRNAFWVVESASEIVGSFRHRKPRHRAIPSCAACISTRPIAARGIAQRMIDQAQAEARALGFKKMILSTAEIQRSAVKFYRKNGFRQLRTEIADAMNPKQAGGGLTRFLFRQGALSGHSRHVVPA